MEVTKKKRLEKVIENKRDQLLNICLKSSLAFGMLKSPNDLEISSYANAFMTYAQNMKILNTGNPLISFEEYCTTDDNKPLWLLTSNLPLRNEDNEIIGLLGISKDITHKKIAEETLLELNAALQKNIKQLVISNAELEQFVYVGDSIRVESEKEKGSTFYFKLPKEL